MNATIDNKTIATETFADGAVSGRGQVDASGVKNGKWEFYYRTGALKGTGTFTDGTMDGEWTWTREDGSLMRTGQFVRGEKSGEWKTFDRGGNLVRTTVERGR